MDDLLVGAGDRLPDVAGVPVRTDGPPRDAGEPPSGTAGEDGPSREAEPLSSSPTPAVGAVPTRVAGAGASRARSDQRRARGWGAATSGDDGWFVAASTTGWEAERDRLDDLADRRTAAYVRDVVLDVLGTESPIEASRLARIVGNRFGFQRVQKRRADEILAVLPRGLRRASPLGTFYWAAGTSPETYRTFRRTPDGVGRPLTEIAPEEIVNALAHVAAASHGIAREQLLRECAELFAARRLTPPVRARLEAVLDQALTDGRLREAGGWIRTV